MTLPIRASRRVLQDLVARIPLQVTESTRRTITKCIMEIPIRVDHNQAEEVQVNREVVLAAPLPHHEAVLRRRLVEEKRPLSAAAMAAM